MRLLKNWLCMSVFIYVIHTHYSYCVGNKVVIIWKWKMLFGCNYHIREATGLWTGSIGIHKDEQKHKDENIKMKTQRWIDTTPSIHYSQSAAYSVTSISHVVQLMWRCPIPDFVNEARSKPLWIQFNCVRRRKVYESHHDTLPLDDFFYSSYYMEDKLFRSFMSGPSAWPARLGGSHRSWAPWLGGIWGGVGCEKPPWDSPLAWELL